MIHTTSRAHISVTPAGDILLFIKKGTRNGTTTSRLATFLSYDGILAKPTNNKTLVHHFTAYLDSKLSSLSTQESITITITTHKKEI